MNSTTVGMVLALHAEARALTGRRLPAERVVEIGEGLLIRVGGMGGAAAAASCRALHAAGAAALISAGCAAGLEPRIRAGTLVVPGEVRLPQGKALPVDADWHAALVETLEASFNPLRGALLSVGGILGVRQKRALHERTGAVAADMESAAVACEANRLGVPFVVVRAVSDAADEALPAAVIDAIDPFGRLAYARLLAGLARRPADVVALARLRRGFLAAGLSLSRALTLIGPGLRCPGKS